MVGQGDADQTEEEIAWAAEAKIARSKRLVRNTEKAAGKRHTLLQDRHDDFANLDEDAGDAPPMGGTTPSLIDVTQPTMRQ
jgi:hypothetical protein